MTTGTRPPQEVLDVFRSVQFVFGPDGRQTGVLLDEAAWEALLDWLEDVEDRASVQEALPRLRTGPARAGARLWEEVASEWDDHRPPYQYEDLEELTRRLA
jgi:hypothetical protein